jgi:uncharacterized protein YhhL (DUF1145 family)
VPFLKDRVWTIVLTKTSYHFRKETTSFVYLSLEDIHAIVSSGNASVILALQKKTPGIGYVTSENTMVDVISNLHFYNMILVLASGAVAGVWGLILFFMKKPINRPWRISLIVAAVIAALQALLGITLVLLGQKPGTGTGLYYLHYVYGAIVVLAIPIAITYATGGKNQRRDTLIFSIAALILVAAALRALTTGFH